LTQIDLIQRGHGEHDSERLPVDHHRIERHHVIPYGQWVALVAVVAFQFAHLNEASLKDLRAALGISIRGEDDTKVWLAGHLEILQSQEGLTVRQVIYRDRGRAFMRAVGVPELPGLDRHSLGP